jgi:hypothetical protein
MLELIIFNLSNFHLREVGVQIVAKPRLTGGKYGIVAYNMNPPVQ